MSVSEQVSCFDPSVKGRNSRASGLPYSKDSGVVYYFRRGLGTGDPENDADSNFYLLYHLFTVQRIDYAQTRLDAYRDGYAKRLTREGLSESQVKMRIGLLEFRAKERVEQESLQV